jgi:[acyl-carrier-protein] S-malonyltransferase
MGRDIAEVSASAKAKFARAGEVFGGDLLRVMFEGPEEELRQTVRTQPAVLLCSAVLFDALRERGIEPVVVAGHSLGEYSALYASGVLDFDSVLSLVRLRSDLMQHAGEKRPGAMAAVLGVADEDLARMCAESSHTVVVANFNAPGQTVISGDREGVAEVGEKCKAAGAKRVLPLPVSGAFHSPLLEEPGNTLAGAIDGLPFADPRVPLVSNIDASFHAAGEEIRANLRLQMTSSVRWTESVGAIVASGVDAFVEVGPGKILAGLIKRIAKDVPVLNVGSAEELKYFQP